MKTICIWLGILLALSLPFSPVSAQGGERIGIRAGFQLSQLKSDVDELFNNSQSRYFVGIYKESRLIPFIRTMMGLEYYETGSRDGAFDLKLGYLSAPMGMQLNLGLFNIYGGVSGAIRLYADERAYGEPVNISGDKYRRFDYSTFAGFGVNLLFVGIDIRHHWGHMEVYDGFENRFWQLGATVKF